ncbi:hypothetical protein NKG05_07805 [Oerskovia sp. M15]
MRTSWTTPGPADPRVRDRLLDRARCGLLARYVLHRQRLSTVLLLSVPLIDLLLVTVSVADVAGGSPPEAVHGLAAVYLGFTVAFGHSIIRWADAHAAYRFGGGPKPVKPPKDGLAGLAHEMKELGKAALAGVIALGVIAALSVAAGTGLVPPPCGRATRCGAGRYGSGSCSGHGSCSGRCGCCWGSRAGPGARGTTSTVQPVLGRREQLGVVERRIEPQPRAGPVRERPGPLGERGPAGLGQRRVARPSGREALAVQLLVREVDLDEPVPCPGPRGKVDPLLPGCGVVVDRVDDDRVAQEQVLLGDRLDGEVRTQARDVVVHRPARRNASSTGRR